MREMVKNNGKDPRPQKVADLFVVKISQKSSF